MDDAGTTGPRDDGTVWLSGPQAGDDGIGPPGTRRTTGAVSLVGVLALALLATAGVAASRHDASVRWERAATEAREERDDLAERLAATETRLAEVQDVLDRTERARLAAAAHLADIQHFAVLPGNVRGPNG